MNTIKTNSLSKESLGIVIPVNEKMIRNMTFAMTALLLVRLYTFISNSKPFKKNV